MWPGTELWHWVSGPNGVQMNSRAIKPNTQWGYHWGEAQLLAFPCIPEIFLEEFHAYSFQVLSVGIPLCIQKANMCQKCYHESVKEMISLPMERGIWQKYFSTHM